MQVWAACLTLCMPRWPQAGPAYPCQPPYLQEQPFSLSWAELGTHMEVPQVCYRMILSPNLHTLPPSLDSSKVPDPVLASQALPRRQVWRCGQPASPTQLLTQAVLQCHASMQTSTWEPLSEQDEGPSCSNLQQHWLCPASCSWADGLEPILGRATLSPVARFGCTQP